MDGWMNSWMDGWMEWWRVWGTFGGTDSRRTDELIEGQTGGYDTMQAKGTFATH